MAIRLSNLHQLKMYLDGVMKKSHHHAGNVCDIIPTIIGNVLIYSDINQIHVGTREGDIKNEIWFCISNSDEWLYFGYNHENETIELREGGRQGRTIARFDNNTTPLMIKAVFEKFWKEAKAA